MRPPADQLPQIARAAKDSCIPKTNEDVAKTRDALSKALGRLDARLDANDSESANWKTYLEWDALKEQMDRGGKPDLKVLQHIHGLYAADHEGLAIGWFTDVRDALEQ